VDTLCTLGYLNRLDNKKYLLGTKVLFLGFSFLNSSSLRTLAKPYLDELSNELGMSVNLTVLKDFDVIILYRKHVRYFFNYDIHDGSRFPAYASPSGRVLLASLDNAHLEKRLNGMKIEKITPKTVGSKEEFLRRIETTRKLGYATVDREQSMDLSSLAVPLIDDKQKTVAAISLSMEVMKKNEVMVETAKTKLIEIGQTLSRHLGYDGPYPRIYY
jgi:IclR family pca regulon transcriptional regulator